MTSHVGRVDWSFTERPRRGPPPPRPGSAGGSSSVRTRAPSTPNSPWARSRPAAGWRRTSIRSRRRSTCSTASCILELDRRVHRLVRGDYAVMPVGLRHTLANAGSGAGSLAVGELAAAAWTRTPVARTRSSRRHPTSRRWTPRPTRPPFGDPTLRLVGHYDGTPPQAGGPARSRTRPAAGRRPGWTRRSSPTAGSP